MKKLLPIGIAALSVLTGAACTLKMRPTTAPSASTSSFHSPDGREEEARLRINRVVGTGVPTLELHVLPHRKDAIG